MKIFRLFLLLLIAFGLARVFLTQDSPPPPWEGKYLPGRSTMTQWEGGARIVQSYEGVMGTRFAAELEGPDVETVRRAQRALWQRVWELEQKLSTWIPSSLLSRVNRDAGSRAVAVDGDTMNVLVAARDAWRATDGAFDPTVGPLLDVWKPLSVQKEMPSAAAIRHARTLVGFDKVSLYREKDYHVRFTAPGVSLDVGGVAKGYAAEAAARAALAAGATACRVNAGGDMFCAGAPRGSPAGFAVAVRDPEGRPEDTLDEFTFTARDRAVATSGNYERFTEIAGKRYSHILDPRTGRPVPDAITQVTVIAPGGAEADALATALTVLGLERGMSFVRRTPGVEALFLIRTDGFIRHHASPRILESAEMRIGYLGGSFDPIHVGHLALARACRESADLDRVVFIVAGQPPHKLDRKLAPSSHRLAMVRRAIDGERGLVVDDREIRRSGIGYTIDTVRELRAAHPDDDLFWIIGADTLPELPTWRSATELLDLIGILSATRPGFDPATDLAGLETSLGPDRVRRLRTGLVEMPPVAVSSTEIRRRVGAGEPIEGLVPPPVAGYIAENALYA